MLEDRIKILGIAPPLGYDEDNNGNIKISYYWHDRDVLLNYKNSAGNYKNYIRTRIKEPEDGVKYKSPRGSGIRPYLNGINQYFKTKLVDINTLFITEGEFKAHKLCAEQVPAIAIGGINSFAKKIKDEDGRLRYYELMDEFEVLLKDLPNLKKIVLIHDSDVLKDTNNKNRVKSFFESVNTFYNSLRKKNYKLFYCRQHERYTNIAKGIDDLLCYPHRNKQEVLTNLNCFNDTEDFYYYQLPDDKDLLRIHLFGEGIEGLLSEQYDFRVNLLRMTIEKKGKDESKYKECNEIELNNLLRFLRTGGEQVSKDRLCETLLSDYSECYHPFLDYFRQLKYDGKTDYISQLADTVKTKDQETFKEHLKKWLVATYACATQKDHVNETALIFISGEQGQGKTRWFQKLMPTLLADDYFHTGQLTGDKDSMMILSECFLINLDELVSLRKNDIELLKQIFSQRVIKMRRPYGRATETCYRVASFVGSDNNDGILSDPTGARRFLIHSTLEIDYKHNVDMNGVWAQAKQLFEEEFKYYFDKEEIIKLNEANEEYRIVTSEEEAIETYLIKDEEGFMSINDILIGLNDRMVNNMLKNDLGTRRRLASMLSKNGFERHRRNAAKGFKCKLKTDELEIIQKDNDKIKDVPF